MHDKLIKIICIFQIVTVAFFLTYSYAKSAQVPHEITERLLGDPYVGTWKDQDGEIYELRNNELRGISYIVTKGYGCQLNRLISVTVGNLIYDAGCFILEDIRHINQRIITLELNPDDTLFMHMDNRLHILHKVKS